MGGDIVASRFAGRTAVVTGAGSGIGLALARELGVRGARVVLVDRDGPAVTRGAEMLAAAGYATTAYQLDVTDRAAVADMLAGIANRGTLDYMFNNAGIGGTLPFDTSTPEHWDQILALNLRATIDGTQAAYAIMAAQGSGHIVNTASVSGLVRIQRFRPMR
jgi:NAD(P)-dependent dehydrogenase (short-subunit alcohol dehydrogenase family)